MVVTLDVDKVITQRVTHRILVDDALNLDTESKGEAMVRRNRDVDVNLADVLGLFLHETQADKSLYLVLFRRTAVLDVVNLSEKRNTVVEAVRETEVTHNSRALYYGRRAAPG